MDVYEVIENISRIESKAIIDQLILCLEIYNETLNNLDVVSYIIACYTAIKINKNPIEIEYLQNTEEYNVFYRFFINNQISSIPLENNTKYSFLLRNRFVTNKIKCFCIVDPKDYSKKPQSIELNTFFEFNKDFLTSSDFKFSKPFIKVNNFEEFFIKSSKGYAAGVFDIDISDIERFFYDGVFSFNSSKTVIIDEYFALSPPKPNTQDTKNKIVFDDYSFKHKKAIKYPISNFLRQANCLKVFQGRKIRDINYKENISVLGRETIILIEDVEILLSSDFGMSNMFNVAIPGTEDPVWFLGSYINYKKLGKLSIGLHDGVNKWNNKDFRVSRDRFNPTTKFNIIIIVRKNRVICLLEIINENNSVLIDYESLVTSHDLTKFCFFIGSANEKNRSCIMDIGRIRFYDCPKRIDSQLNPIIL